MALHSSNSKRVNTKALALALSNSREGRAEGGAIGSIPGTPVGISGGNSLMTKGSILSDVPGRTDSHATHVPSGSYVIPADIVSGRGQGNTIAGSKALERLFRMGRPKAPKLRRAFGGAALGLAEGGALPEEPEAQPVRVNLAGGEIVVPPENLQDVVHPDLKTAHEIMDEWVLAERKKLRKELGRLPGPVKE